MHRFKPGDRVVYLPTNYLGVVLEGGKGDNPDSVRMNFDVYPRRHDYAWVDINDLELKESPVVELARAFDDSV